MPSLDILIPFGLPAPEFAADLLRQLRTPALSLLVARSAAPVQQTFDPFARSLPHEWLLAQRLGLGEGLVPDSSPPLAVTRMRSLGLAAPEGVWFIAQPVHIHIARDQLMLTDPRSAAPTEAESRALFDCALPLFAHAHMELRYGSADAWFVRADDWRALQTATPDAACGRNIDIWMPKGDGERAWRKLQNEVHLSWHEHPVNEVRAERGLPPINSLWLWGAADAAALSAGVLPITSAPAPSFATGAQPLSGLLSALSEPGAASRLLLLDDLSEPALAEDWGHWLDAMHRLEKKWFAPLQDALRDGELDRITLIIGDQAQLRTFTVGKRAWLKFWAAPSLARLAGSRPAPPDAP